MSAKLLVSKKLSFMRLIHLTDPHLSSLDGYSLWSLRGKRRSGYLSWSRKRRHIHRMDVLEKLTNTVASHAPDQILLTGDLVHIGLDSEMAEAAEWLHRLGSPDKVLLIPGNHDNYAEDSQEAMVRHWSDYLPANFKPGEDYTTGFPVVRQLSDIQLIGVNTSCVTRIFSAAGQLGVAQRKRLAAVLKNEPGSDVFQCLLIHHPPFPAMTQRRKALQDTASLSKLLIQQPPDLVLYGHLHHNRETVRENIHCFCTASASSIKDASFRIIDIDRNNTGWQCRVRLMTMEKGVSSGASFRLAEESTWQR
jgi:3',5'-cyclic AMP phosphodiesterase CpdA